MQTTFVLELQFAPAEEYRFIKVMLSLKMYYKVIAFDENNASIRAEY